MGETKKVYKMVKSDKIIQIWGKEESTNKQTKIDYAK